MKKLDNNLVVQHNELIVASYEMTVHEQNVLLACISQIDSRPDTQTITDQDVYTITVEQAKDLFYDKKSERNAYRDLEFASRRLFERKVELDIGNNKTLLTRFVQSIVFDPDAGAVNLRFATEILPYLTQLQNNYTQYRMGQVVELSSVHARRLFELILMWIGQQQYSKEFDLDDFRDLMNVYGKYKQFGELKKGVINPAIKMLNENTDLHVTVAYRKVRRSYRFIQLKFHRKQPEKPKKIADTTKTTENDITKPLTEKQANLFGSKVAEYCHDDKTSSEVHVLGSNMSQNISDWRQAKPLIIKELQDESQYQKYIGILKLVGYEQWGK